jgi:hypothetical protein
MVGFHLPSPTQEPGLELQTVSYFSLLPFWFTCSIPFLWFLMVFLCFFRI